jgi:hypothetical protein
MGVWRLIAFLSIGLASINHAHSFDLDHEVPFCTTFIEHHIKHHARILSSIG